MSPHLPIEHWAVMGAPHNWLPSDREPLWRDFPADEADFQPSSRERRDGFGPNTEHVCQVGESLPCLCPFTMPTSSHASGCILALRVHTSQLTSSHTSGFISTAVCTYQKRIYSPSWLVQYCYRVLCFTDRWTNTHPPKLHLRGNHLAKPSREMSIRALFRGWEGLLLY